MLRRSKSGVDLGRFDGVDGVQLLGNARTLPMAQELGDGLRIQLAARHLHATGQLFRGIEHRVGQGNGDFHAPMV